MQAARIVISVIGIFIGSMSAQAASYDWVSISKVTILEASYMPVDAVFQLESAGGNCEGKLLHYKGRGSNLEENVKIVYSSLLAAMYSQKDVRVYGMNDCTVQFIHFFK